LHQNAINFIHQAGRVVYFQEDAAKSGNHLLSKVTKLISP